MQKKYQKFNPQFFHQVIHKNLYRPGEIGNKKKAKKHQKYFDAFPPRHANTVALP